MKWKKYTFWSILFILLLIISFLSGCGKDENIKWNQDNQNIDNQNKDNQNINNQNKDIWNNNKSYSKEYQKLSNDIMDKWPFYILKVDCKDFTNNDTIDYCNSLQNRMKEISEEITWWEVFAKWNKYILEYDCNKIKLDWWKKECKDYKQKIIEYNK